MKAKFLWASLLLFAGITACTDDAIESQTGNGSKGEGTPAYLSISFSANAGSSTKAAGDNTGDQDGSAEDSGHANAGTADEVAVKTALIVVVPTDAQSGGTGFAKLYSASASSTGAGDETLGGTENEDAAVTVINETTKTYSTDTPIEVTATDAGIEYKVLVVVNPVASLTTSYTGIASGINDLAQAQQLYNAITTGDYTSATPDATYITAASELGSKDKGFMMANRAECVKTVTTANTVENPAKFDLDVERVLSKITFRPKEVNDQPSYVYEVESTIGTAFKAETEEGAFNNEQPEGTTPNAKGTFNKGHDEAGNEVWVLYDNDSKFVGVYGKGTLITGEGNYKDLYFFSRLTPKTQDEYDEGTEEDQKKWYVGTKTGADFTTEDEINSVTLEMKKDESASTTKTFYVKLEGYALTNLSKSVNYVRHTIDVGGSIESPFGTLTTNGKYLYTPGWETKNAVAFDGDGNFLNNTDDGSDYGSTWFYNSLAKVSEESKTLTPTGLANSTCFKTFANAAENPGTVTGDGTQHNQSGNSLPDVGYLLGYCFENSVEADQQRHGLTTGISFVATIWEDEACTNKPLERLYLYAGNNFESIQGIVDAYAGNVPEAVKNLAAKEAKGETISKEELEKAAIDRYEGNVCYYYTNRIKHFDNADDKTMGVMEFAIMRNNIYSLAVKTISNLGDPFIDPTPGIENESKEAALQIEAEIVPWIVRYNDIEF